MEVEVVKAVIAPVRPSFVRDVLRRAASVPEVAARLPHPDVYLTVVLPFQRGDLLDRAYRDPSVVERTVGEVMDRPLPVIEGSASLDDAFAKLSVGEAPAVLVVGAGRPVGIVTKLDLLEYLAHLAPGDAESGGSRGPR